MASLSRPTYAWQIVPAPEPESRSEPVHDSYALELLAAREILRVIPSQNPAGGTLEPLTREWYELLENKRYRRHGRWLPSLLEFDRHANESLVAVGDGLSIDWVRFAIGGANVNVVSSSAERLRLCRHHFALRGFDVNCLHAPIAQWPIAADRTDVVACVFNERPDVSWDELVQEAFRVLRPGGKFIAVVPSQFNSKWWSDAISPWHLFRHRGHYDRFTGKSLRSSLEQFEDVRIWKRHLRRSEMPYVCRWLVLPLAERIMGRFLIAKAFKPLRAQMALRIAA